jgi:plastocyanin
VRRAWLCFLCVLFPSTIFAQSLLDRTPNVTGGWVGVPGTVYFNFLHRFTNSGAPERQVTNFPTFLLGYAPLQNALVGVSYATRSDLVPRFPNEWEFFARYAARFLSIQAGYNQAAESIDGELGATYSFGRVRLLGAGRLFSNAFASDTTRFAIAGGATVRLSRWLALAGDVASMIDARDTEELAWSAALQIGIPYTPHTLSLQAANTNTATLQGSSRGLDEVKYGFEFTIPFTLSRYFRRRSAETAESTRESAEGDVQADMRSLQFVPGRVRVRAGTAVVWKNSDQVAHTVTAEDRSWTSPLMEPGQTFRRVFNTPGTYNIICTPHPFMKAVVEVVS